MISHIKVRSSTTYQMLLAIFGELLVEFYALEANYMFSTVALPTYPPFG